MTKPRYSYIDAIFLSLFSKDLYRDVVNKWQGYGIKYLLLVTFIVSLVLSAFLVYRVYEFSPEKEARRTTAFLFGDENFSFEAQMNRALTVLYKLPKMEFKDDRLTIEDVEQPYIIKDPLYRKELLIFDTTGQITDLRNSSALALLTSRNIVFASQEESYKNTGKPLLYTKWANQTISLEFWNAVFHLLSQAPWLELKDYQLKRIDQTAQDNTTMSVTYDKQPIPVITTDFDDTYKNLEAADSLSLLKKDGLFIYNLDDKTSPLYFSYEEINKTTISRGLTYILNFFKHFLYFAIPLLSIPSVFIAGFLSGLVMLCLYFLAGSLIAKYIRISLPSKTIFRLCCVSTTPVLTASMILPQFLSRQGLVYFLIAIGYIYFAISVQDSQKHKGAPPNGSSTAK